jgi:hypothetical protein
MSATVFPFQPVRKAPEGRPSQYVPLDGRALASRLSAKVTRLATWKPGAAAIIEEIVDGLLCGSEGGAA